jgi:hypothetical protein
VAHIIGIANQPVVLMLVLGTGASTSFQMMLNECLATGHARSTFSATKSQLSLVLTAQYLTCAVTLFLLPNHFFNTPSIVVLCALLTASSALSYQCAAIYFRLVMLDQISKMQAIKVGALPGIASLLIYVGFSIASLALPTIPQMMLLTAAIVPAFSQLLYLRMLGPKGDHDIAVPEVRPRTIFVFAALIALILLSAAVTSLRDAIAASQAAYAALIIVALNSLASVMNTLTRASFLGAGSQDWRRSMLFVGFTAGILGSAIWPWAQLPAKLLLLLGIQIAIIAVIEAARRIPLTSSVQKRIHA